MFNNMKYKSWREFSFNNNFFFLKGNYQYIKDLQDSFDNLKFWAKYSLQETYLMTPQRRQRAIDNMNKNLELMFPKSK